MLSCKDMIGKLSAGVDGELTVLERLSVRFHQFICRDCRIAARNFRALVLSMKNRPPVMAEPGDLKAVDDEFVDRVMAAMTQDEDESQVAGAGKE